MLTFERATFEVLELDYREFGRILTIPWCLLEKVQNLMGYMIYMVLTSYSLYDGRIFFCISLGSDDIARLDGVCIRYLFIKENVKDPTGYALALGDPERVAELEL